MHFFSFSSISPHTLLSRYDNVTIHSWKYSRTIKLTFLSVRSSFSQWFIPLDCRPKKPTHREKEEKGSCTSWSARPSPRRYECQWVARHSLSGKIFLAHTQNFHSVVCLRGPHSMLLFLLLLSFAHRVEEFVIRNKFSSRHRVHVYQGVVREVISAAEDHADGWNRIYLFIMYARLGRTRRQPREREKNAKQFH